MSVELNDSTSSSAANVHAIQDGHGFLDAALNDVHEFPRRQIPARLASAVAPRSSGMPHRVESRLAASPAQALTSLRFLVVSSLPDLERRLTLLESKNARKWASTAFDMLHAIHADVCSHLPDLGAHLPDIDLQSHLPDIDFDFDRLVNLPDSRF